MLRSDFALPGATNRHAPDLALEPIHLELRLNLDLDDQSAQGNIVYTTRCRTAGRRSLKLNAVDLSQVTVQSADTHALTWSYDGDIISICWDEAPAIGDERKVQIQWSVHQPRTGLNFSGPSEAQPNRPTCGATDHETERARYWLPCVDHPSVRTRLDMHIRAPSSLTSLANGALVSHRCWSYVLASMFYGCVRCQCCSARRGIC